MVALQGIETLVPENIAIVPDINFDELPKQIDPTDLGNINEGATLILKMILHFLIAYC